MKKAHFLFGILILTFLNFSCIQWDLSDDILYFNSFESPADTADWKGYCFVGLVNDTPHEGGNNAITVSCGCIGPHSYFKIPSFDSDSYLLLSCWGKGEGVGGGVYLRTEKKSIQISIPGNISTWEEFQSSDTLFCPAGEELTIGLSAGGFAGGTIYVDLLKVIKVD